MMASTPTRTASALDPLEYGASIATPHSSFGILVAPAPDVCDGVDGTVRGNSHRLALSSSHPLTDLRLHVADSSTCAHSRILSRVQSGPLGYGSVPNWHRGGLSLLK